LQGNNKELFETFKFTYQFDQKIPFSELSEDIPNVDFITKDKYLIGFILTLDKVLSESEGEKQIDEYAYFVTSLLSIKSHRYVSFHKTDECIRINGTKRIGKDLTMIYNIEGSPVKLDIKDNLSNLKKLPNGYLYIKYLAKSIKFYQDKDYYHSIIESFKIIENYKQFSQYCKYYTLRNIVAHSPINEIQFYKNKTIRSFEIYFNHNDFDYTKYVLKENKLESLLLDFESEKTQRKLSEMALELITRLRAHLQIN
jgi:hypothetical protein